MMSTRFRSASAILALVSGIAFLPGSALAGDTSAVARAIGGYHPSVTTEQLEQIAGGKEALVAALLELRTDETTPFVGVRAEKLLIGYADRTDVSKALAADVDSPETAGLARTVAIHLGHAPSADARASLARKIVDRANRDSQFMPYARTLKSSTEPAVQSVARTLKD